MPRSSDFRRSSAALSGWRSAPRSGTVAEPLLEGWPREGRMGAGQQGARLIELAIRVGGITYAFDPYLITAPGREQRRDVDEAFLARAGDLRDRSTGVPFGVGGHVHERFGHSPGRHDLDAHLRHVPDVAFPAPLDELRGELVKLRSAQDPRRDRAGERRLLVGDLRR